MKYNPQQLAFLKRFAGSDDGRAWLDIVECAIIQIKDDCVLGDLSKEAAKAAIGKLEELVNQQILFASGKDPAGKVSFN